MSLFGELVGQRNAIGLLERMLANGRVPHALTFHGPEGLGKGIAARAFATALVCENGSGCGSCRECDMVGRNTHPDLLTIKLLPKEKGPADELATQIKIEQVREVNHLAGMAPRCGRRRVFLFDPADRINLDSQNALLKTLEEPPGKTVLILVASRPHLLLPTVRSRCFAVPFLPVPTEELAAHLVEHGMAAPEARARAALAGGRPGVALSVDVDERRERREELLALLEDLSSERPRLTEIAAGAASMAGKDEPTLLAALEMTEGLLRDAMRAGIGEGGRLVHADLSERLAGLASRLGPPRIASLVSGFERTRRYLRFNVNRVLIAESLLAAVAGGPVP